MNPEDVIYMNRYEVEELRRVLGEANALREALVSAGLKDDDRFMGWSRAWTTCEKALGLGPEPVERKGER